jgi:hypothetical protein
MRRAFFAGSNKVMAASITISTSRIAIRIQRLFTILALHISIPQVHRSFFLVSKPILVTSITAERTNRHSLIANLAPFGCGLSDFFLLYKNQWSLNAMSNPITIAISAPALTVNLFISTDNTGIKLLLLIQIRGTVNAVFRLVPMASSTALLAMNGTFSTCYTHRLAHRIGLSFRYSIFIDFYREISIIISRCGDVVACELLSVATLHRV